MTQRRSPLRRARSLSVRSRLAVSAALLVATQGIAAVTFVQYASDQLLDQIDERLVAALGATGGIDDVYQGTLEADRTLITVNSAMIRDRPAAAPSASALASADLGDTPVTVRSISSR